MFLRTFMPANKTIPESTLSQVSFERVPLHPVSEKDMCAPLVSTLLKCGIILINLTTLMSISYLQGRYSRIAEVFT